MGVGKKRVTKLKKKIRRNFKISLRKRKETMRERAVHDFKSCH
jgi:hypothetical protein